MKRRTALLAVAGLLAVPTAARAETTTITMPGKFFDPRRSTIVAGDVVTFRNNDLVTHNVRFAGGQFDSGPMPRFTMWSQQIDQPGDYPFICTLHAFMGGDLGVVAATLSAAPDGAIAGEPVTLSGRAPAGTAHVGVEQSVSGGPWAAVGGGAAPAPDGRYSTTVAAVEGASYRVTTAAGASPVVTPRVTARVDVHLMIKRRHRHTLVRVHTMPAATGFSATLELYSRWHFRWHATRTVKLDRHGGAAFRLRASRKTFARVALRRKRHGPVLVRSGVVRLATGRAAADPNAIVPDAGGAHPGGAPHDGGAPGGHG